MTPCGWGINLRLRARGAETVFQRVRSSGGASGLFLCLAIIESRQCGRGAGSGCGVWALGSARIAVFFALLASLSIAMESITSDPEYLTLRRALSLRQ